MITIESTHRSAASCKKRSAAENGIGGPRTRACTHRPVTGADGR